MLSTLLPLLFLLLSLLAAPAYASSERYRSSSQQQSIFINCGGLDHYRDKAGNVWVGDKVTQYWNTGHEFRTPQNISGTEDQEIYQTERWVYRYKVEMTYEIPILNGCYDVFLHFAEIYSKANETEKRTFNVLIEGSLVLEEYDMVALYGQFTAIVESFTTTVDDGFLTIDFVTGSIQNPKINAIEIHPAVPSSSPTLSSAPSTSPASLLSSAPSLTPSMSSKPSTSSSPLNSPEPSSRPTRRPTLPLTPSPTPQPTPEPTPVPTSKPTMKPTKAATTPRPTLAPTTLLTPAPALTAKPTMKPAAAAAATTPRPTPVPTILLTPLPMLSPITPLPTPSPTKRPTSRPTLSPVVQTTIWSQVGRNITWMTNGADPFDDNCISMSLDGQVLAIGQTQEDLSDFTGRVELFEYSSFFGWSRFGEPIELVGDPFAADFGFSISLNEDGTVIAVGDPRKSVAGSQGRAFVFHYVNDVWTQKGQDLTPGGGVDELSAGRIVSISADGNVVAVEIQNTGRTPDPPTFVRIYRYNDTEGLWQPFGSDVYGRLASVNNAFSLDMCKNGRTFAISAVVPGSGYVEMYKYNGTDWFLVGDAIGAKDDVNETVGITVAMSANGKTVAFGVRVFQSSNLVRVYQYANDTWTQVADDIDSQGEINARRMSLALSNDGKRVAIGPQDRTPFSKVFELKGSKWEQVADDIPSYELTLSGFQLQSIALSGDGDRVAVLGPDGSHVAAYDEFDVEVVV